MLKKKDQSLLCREVSDLFQKDATAIWNILVKCFVLDAEQQPSTSIQRQPHYALYIFTSRNLTNSSSVPCAVVFTKPVLQKLYNSTRCYQDIWPGNASIPSLVLPDTISIANIITSPGYLPWRWRSWRANTWPSAKHTAVQLAGSTNARAYTCTHTHTHTRNI